MAIGFDFRIDRPHLWNGREDPYLYSASMELSANGETIDTLWDEAGLRYFHIDREKGFFLNGRPYPLRGVSRHQDREALGNALTEAQHDEDFKFFTTLAPPPSDLRTIRRRNTFTGYATDTAS